METNNGPNLCMSHVCRTCLQEISDSSACAYLNTAIPTSDLTTIRDKLMSFIPEINLTLTPNAMLCDNCVAAIEFSYKFKAKCLLTEKYISAYIHQTVHSVDLSQILQSHNRNIIDLDEINNAECREALEEKDSKLQEINFLEKFIKNENVSVHDSSQQPRQMAPHNEIQPPEISYPISATESETVIIISDSEEIDVEDSCSDPTEGLYVEQPTQNCIETNEEYASIQCSITNHKNNLMEQNGTHSEHDIKHRCTVCEFGTKYKNAMMLHMMSHTSKKPYKCGECSFQSSHLGFLRRHLTTHPNFSKLHKCSECVLDFKYESCLKVHMIGHTLDKLSNRVKKQCNQKAKLKNGIKIHQIRDRQSRCRL